MDQIPVCIWPDSAERYHICIESFKRDISTTISPNNARSIHNSGKNERYLMDFRLQ